MIDKLNAQISNGSGKMLEHGNAICYSGYREGQNPGTGVYPSYEEIREDLLILPPRIKQSGSTS